MTVLTVDLTPSGDSRVEGDETAAAEVVPQAGGLYGAPGVVAGGAAAVITIKDMPVVDSVTWVGVNPGDGTNLTQEPAETGNGFRLFPDKNTPGPDAPLHNKATVKVRLDRAVAAGEAVTVYIKVFDVDDPSAFVDADDVEVAGAKQYKGGDNRGTGIGPDSSSVVIRPEHNAAVLDITFVNLNPGNNFRAFATTDQALLNEVQLDEAVDNGKSSLNPFRRGADPANKPDPKHASPTLTLWRKLHVELDTMEAPREGENFPPGTGDPNDLDDEQDVSPGGPSPTPDIALAQENFKAAFIDVVAVLAPRDPTDDHVMWVHNMAPHLLDDVVNGPNKNVPSEPGFWTAYVVGAYEGTLASDLDGPNDDDFALGGTLQGLGSAIYLETIRDRAAFAGNALVPKSVSQGELERRTVLHEMAHNFADGFPHDGDPPDTGPLNVDNVLTRNAASVRFVPWQLNLIRNETNPVVKP